MADFWGYHAIINVGGVDKKYLIEHEINETHIKAFVQDLVKRIDMVAYGEPETPYFAAADPNKGGYSLNQFIETSNITGHFVTERGEIYLDIFSCKEFRMKDALGCIHDWFEPTKINAQMITRSVD